MRIGIFWNISCIDAARASGAFSWLFMLERGGERLQNVARIKLDVTGRPFFMQLKFICQLFVAKFVRKILAKWHDDSIRYIDWPVTLCHAFFRTLSTSSAEVAGLDRFLSRAWQMF